MIYLNRVWRNVALGLLTLLISQAGFGQSQDTQSFSGVIISRTYFPDHAVNDIVKKIDFRNGGLVDDQYRRLRDSIGFVANNLPDPMYMAGLFLIPVYSELYFTPGKAFLRQNALGYRTELIINRPADSAIYFLRSYRSDDQVKVGLTLPSLDKVWEKYFISSEEYSIAADKSPSRVAGYACQKKVFAFNGTSRQPALSSRVISKIPWKLTVWETRDLPSLLNVQLPYRFATDGAILKMEVSFEKDGSNKMVWEVTDIKAKSLSDEDLRVEENATIYFEKNRDKVMMDIMQVMFNAMQGM